MAYDPELANRLRDCLTGTVADLTERAMFGGLAFMVGGNLAVSASSQGGLLLRVTPDQVDELITRPHAQRFVMRGKELSGWLRIEPAALGSDAELDRWARLGIDYAGSLPPKRG